MQTRKLGNTNVDIPVIGMGTWMMGGERSPDASHDEADIRAIRRAVELGMTLIDTAEMYAGGHCEEVVADAIKPFPREKLFLVSKIWPNHLKHDDVLKSAEASLKRLRIEYLDLYLVHFPNENVPIGETMKAMETLVERGLVRHIGVCNFSVAQMKEAAAALSRQRLAVGQFDYSLLARGRETDVIPYCREQKMTVMAFKPLARPTATAGLPHDPFLAQIGAKYQKTAAQVALNWLVAREPVIAIPKSTNLKHLEENAGAQGWQLSAEDQRAIADHFAKYLAEWGVVKPSVPIDMS
jgi:diketogulonate reductase-like aldo/keto reductase